MIQVDDPFIDTSLFDDDDNAAIESDEENADILEEEESNPLLLALDDLESRVVAALNEFKSHPGRATDPKTANIHDELASLLRPVVEVSSHVGPSTARALASSYPNLLTIETCIDEIYTRVNSELTLPVVLESAQSDMIPAKRSASLQLFHTLHGEWQKAGSWLDGSTNVASLMGPYGPGVSSGTTNVSTGLPISSQESTRRSNLRSHRRSEILRRWVQSSLPNLAPGTFTSTSLDNAAASRGVLSAGSALKPCLRYMAERIGSADDAGALRLFLPVMRMIGGALGRLFLESVHNDPDYVTDEENDRMGGKRAGKGDAEGDALRSSCIKFLETVVLCFSNKALPGAAGTGSQTMMAARSLKKDASVSTLCYII